MRTLSQKMFRGKVLFDGPLQLKRFQLLLHIVIVSVHGVYFFVDHQMGRPELIVNIFGARLDSFHFYIDRWILSSSWHIVCSKSSFSRLSY